MCYGDFSSSALQKLKKGFVGGDTGMFGASEGTTKNEKSTKLLFH